ncbi:MAG TPA: NifU family protein [Solirubrobacteraceae bacterium]|jgi:Fe-S cluster biogenesis protein NfuA/nitrite reductase/ring-hydroxylating ferredoxin subunit
MQATAATGAEARPEELLELVQELQERLDSSEASATRVLAEDLVSAIVQMYGTGLERILERLAAEGPSGEELAVGLTEDQFLSTLLLIHDLHPVALETRVQQALDSVRPYMESHGGNVELLSLTDGVARIHLRGSCSDCSASSVTLELAIKQALEEGAPDLEGLEVEGVAPQTVNGAGLPMVTNSAPTGMELPVVTSSPPAPPSWVTVDAIGELRDGALAAFAVAGSELVIANVDGTLLSYRDTCAGCGGPLHDGELSAGALSCGHCGRSFFLPRAGRSMDDDHLQLEPVPLLREHGRVKVALAG